MNQRTATRPPRRTVHVGTIVMGLTVAAFIGFIVYLAVRKPPGTGATAESGARLAGAPVDAALVPAHDTDIDPAHLEALIANRTDRVLEEEEAVRQKILEYFRLIYVDMENTANAPFFKERRAELEAYLAGLPPSMVPLLIELLANEKDFINRYILIAALGEIGSDLAADALVAHYHWAKSRNNKIKDLERAIEALGKVGSDHSYDLLTGLIAEEGDYEKEHRYRFVKQLGAHPRRDEAVPLFHDLAANSGQPNVRNYAAQALKRAAKPESAPEIERMLQTEKNDFVRQTELGILGEIRDPASIDALADVARIDDNDTNRRSAVESIYKIGGTRAKEVLKEVADQKDISHKKVGAQTNTGDCPECKKVREAARRRIVALEEQGY